MFRSHPIGRLFDVDIRIHGTVGLLVAGVWGSATW